MDVCKAQPVAATSPRRKNPGEEDALRSPLVPSGKNNATPTSRRPRSSGAISRCKSPAAATASTTRRFASPTAVRSGPLPGIGPIKRSRSVERRPATPSSRPSAPSHPSSRPSTPSLPSSRTTLVRDAAAGTQARRSPSKRAPDGMWPSVRSLPSSFQSDNKEMVRPNSSIEQTTKSSANIGTDERKSTLRGRTLSEQSENARPMENSIPRATEQHRWPAVLGSRLTSNVMSKQWVDLADEFDKSISVSATSEVIVARRLIPSSHGLHRQKELSEKIQSLAFDGSKRTKRDQKFNVNSSSQVSQRAPSGTSPSRLQSLTTAPHRLPSSPNKFSSSQSSCTSRAMPSPIRTRTPTSVSSSCSRNIRTSAMPSAPNYIIYVNRGKKNASQIEYLHQLRLLHNALSQWCFVNALASEATSIQKMRTQSVLYSVWNNISVMSDAVVMKRINVQNLQQQMKSRTIVKQQMTHLEHWVMLERKHCSSLSEAVEVLKASTLQLPTTEGAKADVRAVKNAVSSAVDVMQMMTSSICNFLSKVESTNMLVSELAIVAEEEKSILNECRELLASVAATQVQECSLKTHLKQLKQDA